MKGISFLLFLMLWSTAQSQVISKISFEGNTKSKEVFLRQNIALTEGDVYDSLTLEDNIQLLRNTNLFFDVSAIVLSINEKYVQVIFQLEEVITIFPIIANGGSSERLNFTLGVSDINFRGRGQTIGIVYQYYDRHSLKLYQITPRHKNGRTGHEVFLGKYSTIEPLYFKDGTSAPFDFDNYHVSAAGYFWLNRFLVSKLGGMLMKETYKNRSDSVNNSDFAFLPNQKIKLFKYQVRAQLEYKKVEYHYERRSGIHNLFHTEWIETPVYSGGTFLKFNNDFKYFLKLGERHNLLLKNTSGIATNNDSPLSPFVIDDFVNVRGIGNRPARGTAILTFNSEYLFTAIRHKYFFIQTGVFADLSYLRPPGASFEALFESQNTYSTAGIGMRIHSRKWYNTVFRLDYGMNLKDSSKGGFVFGLGQYF
jgi:outer membrane protein assembly factor BamA